MWIVLNNAFLSIVEPPVDDGTLLVRARIKGDLERVFGKKIKIVRLPNRDYLFRAFIPRKVVADVIAKEVMSINYGNFKNSVSEDLRHDAYARIWGVMFGVQHQLNGRTIADFERENPKRRPVPLFPDDEFDRY